MWDKCVFAGAWPNFTCVVIRLASYFCWLQGGQTGHGSQQARTALSVASAETVKTTATKRTRFKVFMGVRSTPVIPAHSEV